MPEATVLYVVTAVVVAGLVVWVAAVLRTAREPWARAVVPAAAEPVSGEAGEAPRSDADETARATPVALASEKIQQEGGKAGRELGE